jgi:3-hydroxyisobutyrate dehydrogenase
VDAPVSGGVTGAKEGTLTVMMGGEKEAIERIEPILSVLSKKRIHVGGSGSGHAVKALNNLLCATTLLATSEALAIGTKFGVDPQKMLNAINESSGASHASINKFPKILRRTFDVGFTIELMHKDVNTALEMADAVKIPAFLASIVQQFWRMAAGSGGAWDHTAIVKFVEQNASVEIKGGDVYE